MPTELISQIINDTVITEFRGVPPDIPLRAGVNVPLLTEGDSDPFYITVEISTEGRTSKNGLVHDAALADTLVKQINAQASEGIMGHIKEGDRATAFPVSDVHWLGAARHGKSTWAKGYIPRTAQAQREHFRILKATNGRAATSITGPAVKELVDKNKGTWRATNFQLEQLDLAPFTRAALPPDSDFMITREMSSEEHNDMDKTQFLAELTASEVPATVREQILSEARAQVSETQQQLTARDTMISELQTAVAEFRVREFNTAIDTRVAELTNWNVTGDAPKAKLDAFRKTVRSRIVSEMGDKHDLARIAEVVQLVWAELQPLAETVRDALAGPPAIVNGKVRAGERPKLVDTPEARSQARGEFQF